MSPRQDLQLTSELLTAYLEGEVAASDRAAIETALRDDPRAQRRLEQLRHIASCLAAPVPELENVDMIARVRAELAKPAAAQPKQRSLLAWGTGFAVAASVGLFVAFGVEQPLESEFRAKSANTVANDGQRWAGMQIHRAVTSSNLERLGDQLRADEGLVFSYTNIGPQPFRYLMIFALDASGQVRWFYPTYDREGTNPESIAIDPRSQVSLGDVIGHDYAEGTLAIHAVFTRQPLRVSEVEGWLKNKPDGLEQVPIEDASLQVVRIRVVR
jgi:hypothetical protein